VSTPLLFLPGDVVLVRGTSLFSRAIRWATRRRHETPSRMNHGCLIDDVAPLPDAMVTEALATVKTHPFADVLKDGAEVEVWRHTGLTIDERQAIAAKAREYRDRKYGAGKIALHFIDALVNKVWWGKGELFLARRLCSLDSLPMCIWVIVFPYYRAAGVVFGPDLEHAHPRLMDPDHLHDWVIKSPSWWRVWSNT
jgi:hypothetical protein